jgi:hypothetical protein
VLTNWKQDPHKVLHAGSANDGVSFSNVAAELDNIDRSGSKIALATDASGQKKQDHKKKEKAHVTCPRCQQKGHYANECDGERAKRQPDEQAEQQTGEQMLLAGIGSGEFDDDFKVGFTFHNLFHQAAEAAQEVKEGRVPSSWILLDNQSTVDVFHNTDLLKNIQPGKGHMDLHCNAAVTSTNLIGDLIGYGEVWYHPNGIANILPLKRVKTRGHRITYDSSKGNDFHVQKADGTIRVFKELSRGLYYLETSIREAGTSC